jgi:energy-coupling factor transport system permease protein
MAEYASGETFLHRLHPLTKLTAAVLAGVAAFVFAPWPAPAALASFLALLYCYPGIGFRRLRPVLAPLPLFFAVIVLANVFLVRRPGGWTAGAVAGLVQSARVLVIILAANLFLAVTDAIDFSDAVLGLLEPLRRLGLKVGELSLMAMITMSFIPLMADEARRLEIAQAVRCGFPKRGPAAVRAVLPLMAPLMIGLFRRADEIDLALQARGYRLDAPRTARRLARPGAADWLVGGASVLLFAAGLYAHL